MAYLLGLATLLAWILGGVAFFLDRFRVPLLAAVLVWTVAIRALGPGEHVFSVEARESPEGLVADPHVALAARRTGDSSAPTNLTIVTLSGGGIQAAGWGATVLGGLDARYPDRFAAEIDLVSGVSGGSVGAYLFLRGLEAAGGARPERRRDLVVEAATRSGLEAVAWGMVYPDLLRAVFPLPLALGDLRRLDRAAALERAWLEAAVSIDGRPPALDPTLADWARAAQAGRLPGVVFNATLVEDGFPLMLSNLDLSAAQRRVEGRSRQVPSPGRTLGERYSRPLTLRAATAARLSAAFPYVSPIARAGGDGLAAWHPVDGGYLDNSGLLAALEWLRTVVCLDVETGGDGCLALERVEKVTVIEVNAFPAGTRSAEPKRDAAWTLSTVGPVQTLARVRVAGQQVRNALEVELLRSLLGERRFVHLELRPPRLGKLDPPLSWHLSPADVSRLRDGWRELEAGDHLAPLDAVFGPPTGGARPGSPAVR